MSLGVCIPDLVEQGKIPKAKARAISARYERMVAAREGAMGRAAAEADATARLVDALEAEANESGRRAGLQARAQQAWLARRREADGANKPGGGPLSVGAMKRELELTEYRIETVFAHWMIGFDGFLAKHRRNLRGQLRKPAELVEIVRARFGEKVDNPEAQRVADAMGEVMEAARQRRNRAGGNTGKLDSFGLPQSHDSALVGAVSFEEWRAFAPIERAQVRDPDTGDWAQGERRTEILRAAYANISTEGAERMTPGSGGRSSLARQRGDERVIHFADADDWLAYAERFGGQNNAYDTFVGHMQAMARDVVLMEDMGPNPAATLRFRQDWLEKSFKTSGTRKLFGGINGHRAGLQRRFDVISGVANIPDNERAAKIMAAFRAQQAAAKLGSATLSAVAGDTATLLHRAGYNALPIGRTLNAYRQLVVDTGGLGAQQAVRLGLVTDEFLGLHSAAWRLGGEELVGETARRITDGVLRSTVLNRHTRAAQWAFGRETMGYLTEQRGRRFDELAGPVQRMLRKYGIEDADWDAYRATEPVRDGGAEWIVPAYAGEVGEKFGVMLRNERDLAVLMPDLFTRQLLAGTKPGSLVGETLRSILMFKSFSITLMSRHIPEMLAQRSLANRALYGVALVGLTTAFGLGKLLVEDLVKGKDPRAVDEATLAQALIQAGGLGVIGDLIKSSETEIGGGPLGSFTGPLTGAIGDLAVIGVRNTKAMIDGDPGSESHWRHDLLRQLRQEIPGGSIWYLRLALDRLMFDWVSEQLDPDYADSWRRMERYAAEQGTAYFSPPGSRLDARAPDVGNAFDAAPSEPELEGSLLE